MHMVKYGCDLLGPETLLYLKNKSMNWAYFFHAASNVITFGLTTNHALHHWLLNHNLNTPTFSELIEKVGRRAKWRVCLEMGGGGVALLYWCFSRDSSWCYRKTSWSVYFSFLNKHVLQNNCLNWTSDDWYCHSFINSVDS